MLEVYLRALDGDTNDEFLDDVNFGVGNYTDAEYWQQVESFRRGAFAESAMTREIIERAREETKHSIVDAIYDNPDQAAILEGVTYTAPSEMDRNDYYDEHADDIWESLGTANMAAPEHRAVLVHEATDIAKDWTPPHWRMMKARHELSQSKGARALDNLFDRVKEFKGGMPGGEEGGFEA